MKMKKGFATLLAMGTVTLLGTSGVRAERIVAAAGSEANEWDTGCFRHDYGQVRNICGGVARFSVGVRTVSGSRQFKATGCDAQISGGNTACSAIVTDSTGWFKSGTGDVTLSPCSLGQGAATLPLNGALTVAATDGIVFECLIQTHATSSFVGTLDY